MAACAPLCDTVPAMRFTTIGHACLFIEARDGTSILVDPWLSGSCYWRSWWHFPPIEELREEWLAPDHLYLSHYHFDHFHYPSMRRISRRTKLLVPRFGVDTMVRELHALGFEDVSELPHGEIRELAPGLRVASYQHGFDDTAFVASEGGTTLVDLNDCKIRGRALRQLVDDFGRPTFMFRAHSFAMSYPHCYTADDPAELSLVTRESYYEEFIDVARELQPRYAVPFAAVTAYLHPENRQHNAVAVTPPEVAAKLQEAGGLPDTEAVIFQPGDVWDDRCGFRLSEEDWYADREDRLAELAERARPVIERSIEQERATRLRFEDFEAYMLEYMDALPWGLARIFLRRPLVFELPSSDRPYWSVDFLARRVTREIEPPPERASLIWIPEGPLADAIDKRILTFTTGMARMRTHLSRGGVSTDLAFWGLMIIWETGYFPIRRMFTRRFASALWRRRREAYDQLAAIFGGRGSLLQRLSKGFAARDPDSA